MPPADWIVRLAAFELHPSDDLPILHRQVQLVATRIKQVVEELEQARREAMLADRLAVAGELAAGVAHELRNPLTSVKLLIQNAEEHSSDVPLSKEHIHVVLEQIVRMENTIQGLLDFARPPQMQTVRHDLRDTLRLALNLVEGHAKQQDVEVCEDCPDIARFRGWRSRTVASSFRQFIVEWHRIHARRR